MRVVPALFRDAHFRLGVRDMRGPALGIAAWGWVTGVAMVKSGLGAGPATLMSILVYAGSAQLAALPLLAAGAPIGLVGAAAVCVNLRFVIFSAQWRPYLEMLPRGRRIAAAYFAGDLNFVVFMRRFPDPMPRPERLRYFWGSAATTWIAWQLPSLGGIFLAGLIPDEWGIGFAGTLALMAVAFSMIVDRAVAVSAVVAALVAVTAAGWPLHLNLVAAIAAAMAVGWGIDRSRETRLAEPVAAGELR